MDTDECENREEGRGRRGEGEVGVGGKGGRQANG